MQWQIHWGTSTPYAIRDMRAPLQLEHNPSGTTTWRSGQVGVGNMHTMQACEVYFAKGKMGGNIDLYSSDRTK